MTRMIFVNLPVSNLQRAIAFYKALGADQNHQFSDDTAAMMSFSNEINVMLLTRGKFAQFTSKQIADAHASSEVIIALSAANHQAVDDVVGRALSAGGREFRPPEDYGWMYGRSFEDPDGHVWESVWMDPEAAARAMAEEPAHA